MPTLRTDLSFGAQKAVTTMVTALCAFLEVKPGRCPTPKTAFGEELN